MSSTDMLHNETTVFGNTGDRARIVLMERIGEAIAHDIKNPVNNILLSATAFEETPISGEQAVLLEMIKRNARRINQHVTDLVNATNFVRLEQERTILSGLLDDALLELDAQLQAGFITVNRNYCTDEVPVWVDAERMKVAVLLLLSNAIEAMQAAPGKLELAIRNMGSKSIIEIKDSGPGISPDLRQKIFEPYFTTKPGKRGLGLTQVQTIILNHGGTIAVTSHPPNGTTFIVSCPVARPY